MKAKKKIRIWAFGLTALIAIAFAGCSGSTTSNSNIDLSNNQQQKEEAFQQIINNEKLFDEFMNQTMDNTRSMHWMMENQQFMNNMFTDENLDYIMEHNTGLDNHMMNNMMNRINRDTTTARKWNNMMSGRNPMNQ